MIPTLIIIALVISIVALGAALHAHATTSALLRTVAVERTTRPADVKELERALRGSGGGPARRIRRRRFERAICSR